MSETLTYKLQTDMQTFEGPLDRLLHLIAKNKMDILQIQITVIFAQYMQYLDQMRQMNMEIAGEFIVMASELMYIKSRMLLPRPEEVDGRFRVNVWRRRCWNISAQNVRRDIWKSGMFVTVAGR